MLLQRMTMTNLKPNPNEPIFGRRIGLHIRLARKDILAKLIRSSVIFSGHLTEDMIPEIGPGMTPKGLVILSGYSNIYSN